MADNVKFLVSFEVIQEMSEGFPILTWEEAKLTTQTVENRICVQYSAQASWSRFLDLTPRNALTELPVHDIPHGSDQVDLFDPDSERIWLEENIVNILGTPLGSNSLVIFYLRGKGLKHHLFLRFIKYVAAPGFRREAEHMLKGASTPRHSQIRA